MNLALGPVAIKCSIGGRASRTPRPATWIRAGPMLWIVKEPNDQRGPHSSKLNAFGGVALMKRDPRNPGIGA